MRKISLLSVSLALIISFSNNALAQQKQYEVNAIAFYNVENLFDTLDDPFKNYQYFTPK